MPGKSKFQISRSLDERIKRIIGGTYEYDSEFAHVNSAYILGFNYGNVTNCVGLTTNYQLHHAVFPVVGLVFFKSSPTDDDIKGSLKSVKEYSSSPNGLGSFKSDKNEHLFLIYSVDKDTKEVEKRIFNFTKGTFVRRRRLRLNVLNDPYCPRQVHKGPDDLFNLGDGDSQSSTDEDQIDHLIFFIHGVGGVCDVRFRSCVEVVADFKKMANNLLAQQSGSSSGTSTPSNKQLSQNLKKGFFRKHSTESSASKSSDVTSPDSSKSMPSIAKIRRVECLPISWHSCTRRQSGINDQLSLIALSSVPKLRHFLNKIILDALLYSSGPVYTQTIMNNVGDEINRLYTLFMEKHPNFTGSISLTGHSLGSVIVFDLLANQIPLEPANNTTQSNDDISSSCGGSSANDNSSHPKHDTDTRRGCPNVAHHHHYFTPTEGNCRCADYKNLDELLKDMNLTHYAELFQKEHIDINTLLLLTDLDMKELNLPLGARRKLGTYINFKKVSLISAASQNVQAEQKQSETSDTNSNKNSNLIDNMNTGQYLIKYPQLKFKPRCFFAFGSPMPMFLNVRGIQNLSKEYKLPTCDRMMNIYHPYDPIAYRIEPLIDPRFKNVEPVQVPHHRGGKRIHVQLREGFARVGHDIKHRLLGSLRNTWSSFRGFGPVTPEPTRPPTPEELRKRLTKSASSSVDVEVESFETSISHNSLQKQPKKPLKRQPKITRSQSDATPTTLDSIIEDSIRQSLDEDPESELDQAEGIVLNNLESFTLSSGISQNPSGNNLASSEPISKIIPEESSETNGKGSDREPESSVEFETCKIGQLNGGRRLDYVLQEKPIELFNEYIFAFTSHANYWQNEDSALVILNEIYQADNVQLFDCHD